MSIIGKKKKGRKKKGFLAVYILEKNIMKRDLRKANEEFNFGKSSPNGISRKYLI